MSMDPQWVMATSTVVLVLVTAFYAWRTSTIAEGTQEMAAATQRSVDVATTMLVLQHAPIVVPRPGGGGGSTAPDGKWELGVVLQNIGSAPAFEISVKVMVGPHEFDSGAYVTLEPGQDQRKFKFSMRYGDFDAAGKVWSAEATYSDLLNRSYRVARSTTGKLEIELEGEPLRLPESLREKRS